jgi:predicted transcriptional regulator
MKWTKEEIQFLIDNYANSGSKYCAEKLNRTTSGVAKKAQSLKITNMWSRKEEQFLIDNAKKGTFYISTHLNRTISSIQNKAQKLGVSLISSDRYWSKEEEEFLINNAKKGAFYIAKQLNRTVSSIQNKAQILNTNLGNYKFWTSNEDIILKKLYSKTCLIQLSKNLNRSIHSISHRASNLGLKRDVSIDKESTTGYLYVVFFPELNLYKVGITNNPKKRLGEFGVNCNLLSLLEGKYSEIEKLEKYLLNFIKPWLVNSKKLRNGNSETYWVENSS